jgi:hypothetical protein
MTGHAGRAHAAGMANERMIIDEIKARYGENSVLPHPDEVAISERAGTVTLRGTMMIFADDVPDDRIDVSVSAAWITLKGEVSHQSESNAAFDAVGGLPGAGGITNAIKVVAPAGR